MAILFVGGLHPRIRTLTTHRHRAPCADLAAGGPGGRTVEQHPGLAMPSEDCRGGAASGAAGGGRWRRGLLAVLERFSTVMSNNWPPRRRGGRSMVMSPGEVAGADRDRHIAHPAGDRDADQCLAPPRVQRRGDVIGPSECRHVVGDDLRLVQHSRATRAHGDAPSSSIISLLGEDRVRSGRWAGWFQFRPCRLSAGPDADAGPEARPERVTWRLRWASWSQESGETPCGWRVIEGDLRDRCSGTGVTAPAVAPHPGRR